MKRLQKITINLDNVSSSVFIKLFKCLKCVGQYHDIRSKTSVSDNHNLKRVENTINYGTSIWFFLKPE